MWIDNIFTIDTTKGMTQKKLAEFKNNRVFQNEFTRNVHDALNRYTFDGLPDTVSERVLKEALLFYGYAFFYEKDGSLLCLPGMPDGSGMNVYGDFGGAYIYGANGYNERISVFLPGSDENSFLKQTLQGSVTGRGVMIRENQLMFPFINYAMYYAERQADTLRKIEVAQSNAATPYIIVCRDSAMKNTIIAAMQDRDRNMPVILTSGVFQTDSIELMPFDISSDAIKTMSETYDWYSAHFRELCGTKNCTNIDKKGENLLNAEININDEYTDSQDDNTIQVIQTGLDDVNKLFGANIKVKSTKEEERSSYDDIQGIQDAGPERVARGGDGRPEIDD